MSILTVISAHPEHRIADGPRPQNTPIDQTSHTDGSVEGSPPIIVGLGFESQSAEGGQSTVVHAQSVLQMLLSKVRDSDLIPFFEPNCYRLKRGNLSKERAMFELHLYEDGQMSIRTNFSIYNQIDYEFKEECRVIGKRIVDYVANDKNNLIFKMPECSLAFYVNDLYFHGRKAWHDEPGSHEKPYLAGANAVRVGFRAWYDGTSLLKDGFRSGFVVRSQSIKQLAQKLIECRLYTQHGRDMVF